jgi:hypothetical protein
LRYRKNTPCKLFVITTLTTLHGQQAPENWIVWRNSWAELPLEEQLSAYMEMYKTEKILFSYHIYASEMAGRLGTRLIPYLKNYVCNADYRYLRQEQKDITLELTALIVYDIHIYAQPGFEYINRVYPERGNGQIDEADIQWFVEQYKSKIDDYIRENKVIDTTVFFSEIFLLWLVHNDLEKLKEYDHIQYDEKYVARMKKGAIDYEENYKLLEDTLKSYYEGRLDISNLEIKPLEFEPVYME